jgi:hypothetical protein
MAYRAQIVCWLIGVGTYTCFTFAAIAFVMFLDRPVSSFPFSLLVQALIFLGIPSAISLKYIVKRKPLTGFVWLFGGIPIGMLGSFILAST